MCIDRHSSAESHSETGEGKLSWGQLVGLLALYGSDGVVATQEIIVNKLQLKTDILPFLVATIGEWVALFYWLHYLDQGKVLLANIILWAGFLVERVAVLLWVRFVHRPDEDLGGTNMSPIRIVILLIALTLPEVAIWAGWLWLANNTGYLVASVALAVLMQAEHCGELALIKRVKLLPLVTDPHTLFITAMEAGGAIAWLYLVRDGQVVIGGVVLLVSLSIEHIIEGAMLKEKTTTTPPQEQSASMQEA